MCFNFESSIASFVIGTIFILINFYVFRKNKLFSIVNIVWISPILMQLWESFIWKDIECELMTKLAFYTNILQPYLLLLFIPYFLKNNKKNKYKNFKLLIIGIVFLYYTYYISQYLNNDYKCIKFDNKIDLIWWKKPINNKPNHGGKIYFFSTIILMFLLIDNNFIKYSQLFYFVLSVLLSFLFYKRKNYGSIWCLLACYAPIYNYILFQLK